MQGEVHIKVLENQELSGNIGVKALFYWKIAFVNRKVREMPVKIYKYLEF